MNTILFFYSLLQLYCNLFEKMNDFQILQELKNKILILVINDLYFICVRFLKKIL